MFGSTKAEDPRVQQLLDRLEEVSQQLAETKGQRNAQREALALTDTVTDLKTKIADLEIKQSTITEKHAREQRETEHMVGLQRKRGEFETESARREAVLEVREENLSAQQKQFEDQMSFRTEQFDGQIAYLQTLMGQILKRLPTIGVELSGEAEPVVGAKAAK
jgi:hypothetical protein